MAHVPGHNTINPYEYYQEFTSATPTYDTEQAYGDLGIAPTSEFLSQTDSTTGLSYADMIPDYDPYNEEMLRTQFRSGAEGAYAGAVGQLGGIMGQATEQLGQSGFTSSGAIQSAVDTTRSNLQGQYGSAFSDALLSLTSGIRQERLGYQESVSDLLSSFQASTPDQNIYQEVGESGIADVQTGGGERLNAEQFNQIRNSTQWNPPEPTQGASYTYSSPVYGQHTFYAYYRPDGSFGGWRTQGGMDAATGG